MRGQLWIQGANVYAEIESLDLVGAVAGDWQIHAVAGERFVFCASLAKGGKIYPEMNEGRLAMRYPITTPPTFDWAKEEVREVDILFREGAMGRWVQFTVSADELPKEEGTNFRLWAMDKLEVLNQEPTEANGLLKWIQLAHSKGWFTTYSPRCKRGLITASKKSAAHQYVLELRPQRPLTGEPDEGQRVIMCPTWSGFLASAEALVGSDEMLPNLLERG